MKNQRHANPGAADLTRSAHPDSLECPAAGTGEHDEIAAAWAAEVERRIDEYERGESSLAGVDEVIAAARARIRRMIREE